MITTTKSKCILMDLGRRDQLYCMKETSTVQNKQVMVYIKLTRTKVSRRYRILQKKTKLASVKSSEAKLAKTKSSYVKIEEYECISRQELRLKNYFAHIMEMKYCKQGMLIFQPLL
ncbi:uncharacterized protein RHIMIDRAFT_239411 [Rhizopus microsporus ATCC 52813]|uniref:Uncharacterized protein n=1 Tax=Rhizopus microsporus ATCC 52813 TaxID=1340429 RepID=A0A2G4SPC3_RHIZD|nr:uncharacterized protein RHIMIDRAFT_239411 [Rhizopus microsporus ATCC 52813]PHZ10585.1 hypothetical protein RHIMIDRAFT_239411 [Rhizopus microsporus ATCC 52813]